MELSNNNIYIYIFIYIGNQEVVREKKQQKEKVYHITGYMLFCKNQRAMMQENNPGNIY